MRILAVLRWLWRELEVLRLLLLISDIGLLRVRGQLAHGSVVDPDFIEIDGDSAEGTLLVFANESDAVGAD